MGWTSTRDTAQMLQLTFPTLDAAVEFARKEGFTYEVLQPHEKVIRAKSFAENFKWKGPPKTDNQ